MVMTRWVMTTLWVVGASCTTPEIPEPRPAPEGTPERILRIDEGNARRVLVEEGCADPYVHNPFRESQRALIRAAADARVLSPGEGSERFLVGLRPIVKSLHRLEERYTHRRVTDVVWSLVRERFDDAEILALVELLQDKGVRRVQRAVLAERGVVADGWRAMLQQDWEGVARAKAALDAIDANAPRAVDRAAAKGRVESSDGGLQLVALQQRRLIEHALRVGRNPALLAAFDTGPITKGGLINARARTLTAAESGDVQRYLKHLGQPMRQRFDATADAALATALQTELDRLLTP